MDVHNRKSPRQNGPRLPQTNRRQIALGQRVIKIGRAHGLNSSHQIISYAVFCLKKKNPKSDAPRAVSWPTQPAPTKPPPFAPQSFTASDGNPYRSDASNPRFLQILRNANNQGIL